jgi:hypothetical protein
MVAWCRRRMAAPSPWVTSGFLTHVRLLSLSPLTVSPSRTLLDVCVCVTRLRLFFDPTPLRLLSFATGIFTMGEKLGMDATEDIRILVLLWKMGCREKPAQILKQEWMQGCSQLQVDSWEKMQALVPTLDTGFMEQTDFKDFYKFCFQFNRQGTHRTLDKDLVVALLKLVLKERVATDRLETFCEFLETSAEQHSRITLDQWTSFLDFCLECEDLSTYDESTSAWPVLLDEYVDWIEERQKKK